MSLRNLLAGAFAWRCRRARDGATRQVPGQHRLAGTESDPKVRVVEVSVNPGLYERGHIPGAANVSWHTDLVDTVSRDIAPPAQFQALLARAGIDADTTTILCDNNNWFAAWGAWVFDIYGIQNVKLLDGGRKKWEAEGRPLANSATVHAPGNARVKDANRLRARCRTCWPWRARKSPACWSISARPTNTTARSSRPTACPSWRCAPAMCRARST